MTVSKASQEEERWEAGRASGTSKGVAEKTGTPKMALKVDNVSSLRFHKQ